MTKIANELNLFSEESNNSNTNKYTREYRDNVGENVYNILLERNQDFINEGLIITQKKGIIDLSSLDKDIILSSNIDNIVHEDTVEVKEYIPKEIDIITESVGIKEYLLDIITNNTLQDTVDILVDGYYIDCFYDLAMLLSEIKILKGKELIEFLNLYKDSYNKNYTIIIENDLEQALTVCAYNGLIEVEVFFDMYIKDNAVNSGYMDHFINRYIMNFPDQLSRVLQQLKIIYHIDSYKASGLMYFCLKGDNISFNKIKIDGKNIVVGNMYGQKIIVENYDKIKKDIIDGDKPFLVKLNGVNGKYFRGVFINTEKYSNIDYAKLGYLYSDINLSELDSNGLSEEPRPLDMDLYVNVDEKEEVIEKLPVKFLSNIEEHVVYSYIHDRDYKKKINDRLVVLDNNQSLEDVVADTNLDFSPEIVSNIETNSVIKKDILITDYIRNLFDTSTVYDAIIILKNSDYVDTIEELFFILSEIKIIKGKDVLGLINTLNEIYLEFDSGDGDSNKNGIENLLHIAYIGKLISLEDFFEGIPIYEDINSNDFDNFILDYLIENNDKNKLFTEIKKLPSGIINDNFPILFDINNTVIHKGKHQGSKIIFVEAFGQRIIIDNSSNFTNKVGSKANDYKFLLLGKKGNLLKGLFIHKGMESELVDYSKVCKGAYAHGKLSLKNGYNPIFRKSKRYDDITLESDSSDYNDKHIYDDITVLGDHDKVFFNNMSDKLKKIEFIKTKEISILSESENRKISLNKNLNIFIESINVYQELQTSENLSEIKNNIKNIALNAIQKKIGDSVLDNTTDFSNPINLKSKSYIFDLYFDGDMQKKEKLERKLFGLAIGKYVTLDEFIDSFSYEEVDNNKFKLKKGDILFDIESIVKGYGLDYCKRDFNVSIGDELHDGNGNGIDFSNEEKINFNRLSMILGLMFKDLKIDIKDVSTIHETKDGIYNIFTIISDNIVKTVFVSNYYGNATYIYDTIVKGSEIMSSTLREINGGKFKKIILRLSGENPIDKWLSRIKTSLVGVDTFASHDKNIVNNFTSLVDKGVINLDTLNVKGLNVFFAKWNREIDYYIKHGEFRDLIDSNIKEYLNSELKINGIESLYFKRFNENKGKLSSAPIQSPTLVRLLGGDILCVNYSNYYDNGALYISELVKKYKGDDNLSDNVLEKIKSVKNLKPEVIKFINDVKKGDIVITLNDIKNLNIKSKRNTLIPYGIQSRINFLIVFGLGDYIYEKDEIVYDKFIDIITTPDFI